MKEKIKESENFTICNDFLCRKIFPIKEAVVREARPDNNYTATFTITFNWYCNTKCADRNQPKTPKRKK